MCSAISATVGWSRASVGDRVTPNRDSSAFRSSTDPSESRPEPSSGSVGPTALPTTAATASATTPATSNASVDPAAAGRAGRGGRRGSGSASPTRARGAGAAGRVGATSERSGRSAGIALVRTSGCSGQAVTTAAAGLEERTALRTPRPADGVTAPRPS